MRFLVKSLLFSLCLLECAGQVSLIDFSESHSADVVTESGVQYRLFEGRNRFIRIEKQDVRIRFPGGRTYELRVDRGSFDLNADDQIVAARLITELMPTPEAAELMSNFKKSFGAQVSDVDRWVSDVSQGKHKKPFKFNDMAYGTSVGEHFPKIQLVSKSSQNPTYEWNFSLGLEWYANDYPEGWDESKAAANNPKPPAEYEVVSLNLPSGRFYSRKEGFEIAYDIDLDKQPEVNAKPSTVDISEQDIEEPAEEVVVAEAIEGDVEQSPQWWLWLIGVVVVVGGIGLVVRHKS